MALGTWYGCDGARLWRQPGAWRVATRTRVQSARARFAFEAGVDGPAGVDGALEDGAGSGIHLQTVVSSVVASALRKESSALRVESEANGTVRRGREDAEMAEREQTERSRGAAEGKCIPWQPAHHLLVVFTASIPCCFSKDMQKNTSAQTDEGANASTNQSRRDAHTEYVLRFTQRGKGAQELGVERQVQGHGACELASAATLADEPTDSHVNHAARGTASHEKRERRAAAHAFIYATRTRSFATTLREYSMYKQGGA